MYHPLLPDPKTLKDVDIHTKISDISRKYNIAARMGNIELCQQMSLIIEALQVELSERASSRSRKIVNNTPLDKLIKTG